MIILFYDIDIFMFTKISYTFIPYNLARYKNKF